MSFQTMDFSRETIDHYVSGVLDRTCVRQPPIDAFAIAQSLDVDVVMDQDCPSRGRSKSILGRATVLLRPDARQEREQWVVAHELGEIHAKDLCMAMGLESHEVATGLREQIANLFASRLLLPEAMFVEAVRRFDGDLSELKASFSTASHELIALRLLDLDEPRILTVFDCGRMTRRVCNLGRRPGPLAKVEQDCRSEVCRDREMAELNIDEVRVRCWPIDDETWQREILITEVNELAQ